MTTYLLTDESDIVFEGDIEQMDNCFGGTGTSEDTDARAATHAFAMKCKLFKRIYEGFVNNAPQI